MGLKDWNAMISANLTGAFYTLKETVDQLKQNKGYYISMRNYDIKCTTIMPGSVTSHFSDHIPDEADEWKIRPSDLAQIVVDLLKMTPNVLPSKIEVRPTHSGYPACF